MSHSGAARAAIEEMTRDWAARGADDQIGAVALALGRFDTESLRKYASELTQAPRAPSRSTASAGRASSAGWRRSSLVARTCAERQTITLDGGADDWWEHKPPRRSCAEPGAVPTEERRRP